MKTKITLNKEKMVSKIDKRLYGSFIEHLGRAVYNGIYEPTHKTADDMGFRQDVLNAVKDLDVPIVRYPGGNFVSGYNWEDGTGDRSRRVRKMELAWKSVEPNLVGTDEFQEWAKRAGCEVMMSVNLGTRGPDEARQFVEYCNGTADTYYANKRRENGFEEPFGIKLWCLGNEMDGPWQIGAKTPQEYARIAHETAKLMKTVDPSIELVACGSSHQYMPTFGEWERTVLRECYDCIDYISMHEYYGNKKNDYYDFATSSAKMDRFIKKVAAICDEIGAEKKTDKKIHLSFDEWNVWFHSKEQDKKIEKWQVAPPLLEDIYTFEDALCVGGLLNTLIKNADRVKIACLAQLVNVIAPIMTENDGRMWLQTIFYPYFYASHFGRGTSLAVELQGETFDTDDMKAVPYTDVSAVLSEDGKRLTVFAVNYSKEEETGLAIEKIGFEDFKLTRHTALECDDLKAVNTADAETVRPIEKTPQEQIVLAPHSWNMLVFEA